MQFLLLIYHAEAEWNKLTPADMGAMHKDYFNFRQEIKDSGHYIGGNPLKQCPRRCKSGPWMGYPQILAPG